MKMNKCALLDTSFLIRLLNPEDKLHLNALNYFKYFLENDICLKISTIALAEFCVKGEPSDLPLRNVLFLPFNVVHAVKAGKMIEKVWSEKKKQNVVIDQRAVIPNDTKMFAQADVEKDIVYFVSADSKASKVHSLLASNMVINFEFIDINTPYNSYFGVLNLE
jgi:predicted nucleic acid-binding protein